MNIPKVHGLYPMDQSFWKTLCEIPLGAVKEILFPLDGDNCRDDSYCFPNKGYRIFQLKNDIYYAIYNYDGKYYIISANEKDFGKWWKKNRTMDAYEKASFSLV